MPLHALLYRRPSEPQTIEIVFDRSIYPVRMRRHRQARRYTLRIQAATREVVLTIPPRGTLKEGARIRQEARRLDRGPARAPAGSGAVRARRGRAAARRAAPDRASPRRARHGLDRKRRRTASSLLCVAGKAPHVDRRVGDFLRREAKRELEDGQPAVRARARSRHPARHGARSVEPLGLLLDDRRAVVFLAAHSGAAVTCSTISPRTKSRISSK